MSSPSDGFSVGVSAGAASAGALAPSPASRASVFWNPPWLAIACAWAVVGFLPFFFVDGGSAFLAAAAVWVGAVGIAVVIGDAGGGGGAWDLISSNGSSFSSHCGLGALGAMATSCLTGVKQSISTWKFQTPSARSPNVYTPCGSVTATFFWSSFVAVTVAPGSGRPPNLTCPWCWTAARRSAIAAARRPTFRYLTMLGGYTFICCLWFAFRVLDT